MQHKGKNTQSPPLDETEVSAEVSNHGLKSIPNDGVSAFFRSSYHAFGEQLLRLGKCVLVVYIANNASTIVPNQTYTCNSHSTLIF